MIASATEIKAAPGTPVEVKGSIDGGVEIDLSWAATGGMACFPGTQFEHFDGNHVMYAVDMPERAIMTVTATPANAATDVSLYAYQVPLGERGSMPPKASGISCEASYGGNLKVRNPGAAESVKLTTVDRGYRTLIGIAGPRGVKTGSFTLKIDIQGGPVAKKTGVITSATEIKATPGTPVAIKGSIDGGVELELRALCVPEPQHEHFQGNHVVYALDMPERAILTITVTPADAATDVSLYAYQASLGDKTTLPPKFGGLACAASYGGNRKVRNPGASETLTLTTVDRGYRTYIGIAGPRGVKTGAFTLTVELKK